MISRMNTLAKVCIPSSGPFKLVSVVVKFSEWTAIRCTRGANGMSQGMVVAPACGV